MYSWGTMKQMGHYLMQASPPVLKLRIMSMTKERRSHITSGQVVTSLIKVTHGIYRHMVSIDTVLQCGHGIELSV